MASATFTAQDSTVLGLFLGIYMRELLQSVLISVICIEFLVVCTLLGQDLHLWHGLYAAVVLIATINTACISVLTYFVQYIFIG